MPPTIYRAGNIKVVPVSGFAQNQSQIEKVFLQMVADSGVAEIRKIAGSGIFRHPTGSYAAAARGIVDGKAIVWFSDVSYAGAIEEGVRAHQMWYLMNKTVPITVYRNGSELKIYRRCTLKSLLAGKWFHKGYQGKHVFQRAIQVTLARLPEILAQAQTAVVQLMPPRGV